MQFLLIVAYIVGGIFAFVAVPWLVLGVTTIYFKLCRAGTFR
jgi:hypothetical protein